MRHRESDSRSSRPVLGTAVLVGTALLLGGCGDLTAPLTTAWRATLNPVPPYTVGGRAAALTRGGRTQLTISIEDADPVPHRWRVETGTCAAPDELLGGTATYPILTPSAGGSATADAAIGEEFRSGQVFLVRVIRSPEGGPEETAACAQFTETNP